jgi:hypothetical protein
MRGALLIALLVAAVGCGAGEGAPTATPRTSLQISFWPSGPDAGAPKRWTLRCDPTGGTLPRRAAACTKLDAMTRPFAPLRKDLVCTEQYGGPGEAVVSGTFEGTRVWIRLTLRNGCEISRAKKLGFLVPGLAAGSAAS